MKRDDQQSLVSVIVTTRNEERNIKTCLQSIRNQTYKNIEILVIDNNSTDTTKKISKQFTNLIFNKGPERSAQRNYGALKAKGKFLVFLDADMKLAPSVIEDCVNKMQSTKCGGIIIPEESYGVGFWARCKQLERSFYVGNDYIEAARFYKSNVFNEVGGFDEGLTGPEDWDLSQRVRDKFGLSRIYSFIYHNEGELSLKTTLKKKFYYSKKILKYSSKNENSSFTKKQLSLVSRYAIFLSNPKKLFRHPIIGLGMLFMKTSEFAAGGLGMFAFPHNND